MQYLKYFFKHLILGISIVEILRVSFLRKIFEVFPYNFYPMNRLENGFFAFESKH
jgi:hypothetical protein